MSDELVQRLQRALDFWMPAIAGGDGPDSERAASDAALLIGLEKYEADCYGDRMLDEIDRLRAEVDLLRAEVAHVHSLYWDCDGARERVIAQWDAAKSALAALRKRVEEAPTGHWTYIGGGEEGDYGIVTDDHNTINQFEGKRVALVVLDY